MFDILCSDCGKHLGWGKLGSYYGYILCDDCHQELLEAAIEVSTQED